MDILKVIASNHKRPKFCNISESTRGCIILKTAINIKELYGNSGNRFEKINTRRSCQKIRYILFAWFLLASWVVIFLFPLSRVYFH